MKQEEVQKTVRERYGKIAKESVSGGCGCGCGSPVSKISPCCGNAPDAVGEISKKVGYSEEEIKAVPEYRGPQPPGIARKRAPLRANRHHGRAKVRCAPARGGRRRLRRAVLEPAELSRRRPAWGSLLYHSPGRGCHRVCASQAGRPRAGGTDPDIAGSRRADGVRNLPARAGGGRG